MKSSNFWTGSSTGAKTLPKVPTIVRHSEIQMEKIIANGGFAEVWLGTYLPTGKQVAIKKLYSSELSEEIMNEINIHASLHHQFIANFVGYTDEKPFCILTEYVPNGTLYRALHINDESVRLSPTDLTIIATGIASAMEYLHSKNIIHKDLKTLNVLLDSRNQPKICDFGISMKKGGNTNLNKSFGTASIMPPEQHKKLEYNESVDVYAFGIMLWEMLTREIPFDGIDQAQIIYAVAMKGKRPLIPNNTPKLLDLLIRKCWNQNPQDRPSFYWIFSQFSSGNVQFPGTISSAVSNFFSFYGFKTSINSVFVFSNNNSVRKHNGLNMSGRGDSSFNIRMELSEIYDALSDPHTKKCPRNIIMYLKNDLKMMLLMGSRFWELLFPYLIEDDEHIHKNVLNLLLIAAKNQYMLDYLNSSHQIYNYVHPKTLELFLYIFCFQSTLISQKLVLKLESIISKSKDDNKVVDYCIRLLCKILDNTSDIKIQKLVVKFFLQIINESVEHNYGSFILKIITLHSELIKVSKKKLLQLASIYLHSSQQTSIAAAYQVIMNFNDTTIITLDDCLMHFQSDYCPLREISLEFFRSVFLNDINDIEIAKKIVIILFNVFSKSRSQNASLLLFYFASKSLYSSIFLDVEVQNEILTISDDLATDIFPLFILMLKIDPKIFLNNLVSQFIASILKYGDLHSFSVLCYLISNYDLPPASIKKYEQKGIISMICERTKNTDNLNVINYVSKALVKFIPYSFFSDYEIIITKLVEQIKYYGAKAYPCLIALSMLSEYNQIIPLLISLDLDKYLSKFFSLKDSVKYVQSLESKIQRNKSTFVINK